MNSTALELSIVSPTGDLRAYERAVHAFPVLTAEEEYELATQYRATKDVTAAWRLVTSHLRFVVKLARKYEGYGLPRADIIQEGNVGLMKAVKVFDPAYRVRFVSFAVHHIKAEIHDYVLKNWRLVKVATGRAQRKLFYKLKTAKKKLGWINQLEADEIAEELGVGADDVLEMDARLHASDTPFDGAAELHADGRQSPAETLEDNRYNPSLLVEEAQWRECALERLMTAMSTLDPRSENIIRRRWIEQPKATLQELSSEYGVSIERIRQIEKRALEKLKQIASDIDEPANSDDKLFA